MNKLLTLILLLASATVFGQARGSLGIGGFAACPQNELKDISYDDGWGMNINYLGRERSIAEGHSFQYGIRFDFSDMSDREFGTIPLNTPTADVAELQVHNQMFGFFGVGRYYWGNYKLRPFAEALVGLRTFNTQQHLVAQNPELNPEFETSSVYDRVVYTNRFHYGGSLGLHYRLNKYISFESSVTYTEGGTGAVMPLQDIEREGDILRFPHQSSPTDMLLINAGIRIHFHRSSSTPNRTSSPRNQPQQDYTPPPSRTPKRDAPPPPPPPPKKKLEVKPPSKPKKIDTSDS